MEETAGTSQPRDLQAFAEVTRKIAHDFAGIFTIILTNLEFVESDLSDVPPTLREDLNEVKRAAQRGKDLVTRLSTMSRQATP